MQDNVKVLAKSAGIEGFRKGTHCLFVGKQNMLIDYKSAIQFLNSINEVGFDVDASSKESIRNGTADILLVHPISKLLSPTGFIGLKAANDNKID